MNSEIAFRAATPEDRQQLHRLHCAAYDKVFTTEWWQWAYRDPPGGNRTYVMDDAGNLAGSYACQPSRLWLNGHEVPSSLANNVATHPDYQGRGVFVSMGLQVREAERLAGADISLGMPNRKALPGHLKAGWDVLMPLPIMAQTCRRPWLVHDCVQIHEMDERFDRFIERIKPRFSFLPLKDSARMTWRLFRRPHVYYTVMVLPDADEIRGYIVLKRHETVSHIVDMHAETDEALDQLLTSAESYSRTSAELNLWTNPAAPYREALKARGFVDRASSDRVIWRANSGTLPSIGAGFVSFNYIDNDVH